MGVEGKADYLTNLISNERLLPVHFDIKELELQIGLFFGYF